MPTNCCSRRWRGSGRIAEGEAHLASASKLFEADGLDSAPLRELWRTARARSAESAQGQAGPVLELVSASLTEVRRLRPGCARRHRAAHPLP